MIESFRPPPFVIEEEIKDLRKIFAGLWCCIQGNVNLNHVLSLS